MKLDANKILKKDTEGLQDFSAMEKESFVDVSLVMERQPIALSFGTYDYKGNSYPVPFGSYGDFSCIVGASKSMKTFLKSALIAGYIGGQAQNYFPDAKGHGTEGKLILDIDTEQSLFHTQKVARRVCEMVGSNYDLYRPYALRDKDAKTRFQFLEWLIMESDYKNDIGLVTVDGSADLLENVNDLETSNAIVQGFMKWTKLANCHLITVLHRNHGSMKPTGHLGSAILKKAETVAFVERKDNAVSVTPEYTRNFPFKEFSFRLNNNFLPEQDETFF